MTVKLTLDVGAGADLGGFDLYSDIDSYTTKFNVTEITRQQLLDGYISSLVPNGTTIIRITSVGSCGNSYDSTISFLTKNILLSTTSTSATWSPNSIINSGATLTWDATGDITPTSQIANYPTFDLSANTGFVNMDVYDVSSLTEFKVFNLSLTSLNVSNATALTILFCDFNSLQELDVSVNTSLTELSCNSNGLIDLDVSTNINLTLLSCNSNELTSLNISTNINLTTLYCHSNSFSSTVTNSILASLVAHNKFGGTLHYRNNETGQGIADKATLTGRGWTIIDYAI